MKRPLLAVGVCAVVVLLYRYGSFGVMPSDVVNTARFSKSAPLKFTDEFARFVMWPLYRLALDPPQELRLRLQECFGNATFLHQVHADCDMFCNTSTTPPHSPTPTPTDNVCVVGLAVLHEYGAIVVGFPHTVGAEQWRQEFDFLHLLTPFPGGGRVARFLLHAVEALWHAGLHEQLTTALHTHPDYEVWLSGYSFGGALAVLAGAYASEKGLLVPERVRVMTFGQMRVGDVEFARRVPRLMSWVYRVVHAHDDIPFVASSRQGYQHHGTEVWYPGSMHIDAQFVVCRGPDEQLTCSAGVPENARSRRDHFNYFLGGTSCLNPLDRRKQ